MTVWEIPDLLTHLDIAQSSFLSSNCTSHRPDIWSWTHAGLVRSALFSEERLRRHQANLCLYCGRTGYFLPNCPIRPSKPSLSIPVYFQVSGSFPSHLVVPFSLQVASGNHWLGGLQLFSGLTLVKKLGIPLFPKKQRLTVHLAENSLPSSGIVTQETAPLLTMTDSGHQELVHFDVLFSPKFLVILGIPWL